MDYKKALYQARQQNYDLGTCARIVFKNKVLLLKRAPKEVFAGLWEMPGGGVEKAEDPKVALVREIYEEINLIIKLTDLVFVDYFDFYNIEKNLQKRKFCFQVIINKPTIKISNEHENFKLFKKEELLNLVSSSQNKQNYQIWEDHYDLVLKGL